MTPSSLFKTTVFTFSAIHLVLLSCFAQDVNFNFKSYDWKSGTLNTQLSASEKNLPTLLVFKRAFVEYSFNEKGNLQKFYLLHTLKYVNDNKSVEENNKIYLPVSLENGLIAIKNRLFENGKIISESGVDDIKTINEENNIYKIIALKGVKTGSMIETIISMQLPGNLYDHEYMQGSMPIKKAEFLLISPKKFKFACKSYNTTKPVVDSVAETRRFSYFQMENIPVLEQEEKYTKLNANQIRLEYIFDENLETGKKFLRWPDIGRNYFERIYSDLSKNEKEIDKLLKKIKLSDYKTEEQKIFAIEAYVKSNFDLQKNAESEDMMSVIVKNKYGNEYSLIKLMLLCLHKAGINNEIVITCKRSYKRFDPDFDSWSYARNILIHFPTYGKYVDPESMHLRYGIVDNEYLTQKGVFVKTVKIGDAMNGISSIKLISPENMYKNDDLENYTVTLSADLENTTIEYDRNFYNYADQDIRSYYYFFNEVQRKEFIEPFIKGFAKDSKVNGLEIKNYNLNDFNEYGQPLHIKATLTTNHYNEKADDKVIFRFGELIGPQMEMYQEKPRQNQIDIEFPHNYQRSIRLQLPAGYTAKGLDKLKFNYAFTDKDGKASYGFISDYTLTEKELIVTCREYYNFVSYPKNEFENFRKVINAAADFNKVSIVLIKK